MNETKTLFSNPSVLNHSSTLTTRKVDNRDQYIIPCKAKYTIECTFIQLLTNILCVLRDNVTKQVW